jgi:hypothetical protein
VSYPCQSDWSMDSVAKDGNTFNVELAKSRTVGKDKEDATCNPSIFKPRGRVESDRRWKKEEERREGERTIRKAQWEEEALKRAQRKGAQDEDSKTSRNQPPHLMSQSGRGWGESSSSSSNNNNSGDSDNSWNGDSSPRAQGVYFGNGKRTKLSDYDESPPHRRAQGHNKP